MPVLGATPLGPGGMAELFVYGYLGASVYVGDPALPLGAPPLGGGGAPVAAGDGRLSLPRVPLETGGEPVPNVPL